MVSAAPCLACRRGIALSLVAVSLALAFETGRHSVHHLSQPGQASNCALAAEANREVADTAAAPAGPRPAEPTFAPLPTAPRAWLAFAECRPARGRAPPPPGARRAVVTG